MRDRGLARVRRHLRLHDPDRAARARRGKIGAEPLRDPLDGVFEALLDRGVRWGAGLLKWGGDALLLLFDGPGHPERAARAAWEMQEAIDHVGRFRVGSGSVTLRMSIGIHDGHDRLLPRRAVSTASFSSRARRRPTRC